MTHALVIGEALVDVVRREGEPEVAYAGGSAANVAVALARLERDVRFATCFAEDDYGALIAAQLSDSRVRLAVDPHTIGRTSSAIASIQPDGSAEYVFDLDWRPADPGEEVPLVFHTISIGAVRGQGADTARGGLGRFAARASICYEINAPPSITGTGHNVMERVERLVSIADVVKASDEDFEALWPERSMSESLWALSELGPAAVIATRGPQGVRFVAGGQEETAPAVPTSVADTIGAGDTFGAGLIDALWQRDLLGAARRDALAELTAQEWVDPLHWAARCAAITVSRPGADPPRRADLA